jgi:hypothetical protein
MPHKFAFHGEAMKISRSDLVQFLATTSVMPQICDQQRAVNRTDPDCIDLRNVREAISVGPRHFGVLEDAGILVIRQAGSPTRRYNLPRPPNDQLGWAKQPPPSTPISSRKPGDADAILGDPDEIVTITNYGPILVWLSREPLGSSYLTRFYYENEVFETISLGVNEDIVAFYLSKDVFVVRRDMTQICIPWR